MYKPSLLLTLLAASFLTSAPPAFAKEQPVRGAGIAAVVGGDAITSYDVEARMKFIMATTQMTDQARLRPAVTRTLIDELLQIQEAGKQGISVSDQEIIAAIAGIENQRGMPPGTIARMLDAKGVSHDTFTQQIQAQLLWHKLLMTRVRPRVRISESEVALAMQKAGEVAPAPAPAKAATPPLPRELKIAVLTLPVDAPDREAEQRKLGEKLVADIRGGASFEEVSRQFSSSAASAGGKVESFWVKPAQLASAVAKALETARAGTVTKPIRTAEGFTIIKVYDTRTVGGAKPPKKEEAAAPAKPKDTEFQFKEIFLKAKADTGSREADAMLEIGREVAKNPGTCEEKTVASIVNAEEVDLEVRFLTQLASEMPADLRAVAGNLKEGGISEPLAAYDGLHLYMLCGKKEVDAKPVDRERVYNMLFQQKMELESQKYLRNLRREAFVDVR